MDRKTLILLITSVMVASCIAIIAEVEEEVDAESVTITVTYDLNGGSGHYPTTESITKEYGHQRIDIYGGELPTKDHAIFQYWLDEDTREQIPYGETAYVHFGLDREKSFKAIWEGHWEATVYMNPTGGAFDHFDGICKSVSKTEVDVFTIYIPMNRPEREGYAFQYWAYDIEGKNKITSYEFQVPEGTTKTIYAVWKETYDVQFEVKEGFRKIDKQTRYADESIILPGSVTYNDEQISGWYDGNIFVGKDGDSYVVTKNVTLTASYAKKCGIYYEYGDHLSKYEESHIGASYRINYTPAKEHYTLEGWTLNGKLYKNWDKIEIQGDTTFIAKWAPLMRTVTFNSNGGTEIAPITIQDGEVMSPPKSPTMKGFTFKGWYLNGEEWHFSVPVTKDMTLIAEYEPREEPELDITMLAIAAAVIMVCITIVVVVIRKRI